jgi:hypothetical protein
MWHWLHKTWLSHWHHLSLWWWLLLLFTHSECVSSSSHNLVIDSLFESCDLSLPPAVEAADGNGKADCSDECSKHSQSISLGEGHVAHGSVGLANCGIACDNFVDKSHVVIAHLWSVINKPGLSGCHNGGFFTLSKYVIGWIIRLQVQVEEGVLDLF